MISFKASAVLTQIGRYTHRVAISNNRLVKVEDGLVTFRWRDYRDKNKEKLMTIDGHEFIRRFLMHVLPRRFVKIRHYGILSNRNRQCKLLKRKKLTGVRLSSIPKKLSTVELLIKLTGRDITLCPCCHMGHMKRQSLLPLMTVVNCNFICATKPVGGGGSYALISFYLSKYVFFTFNIQICYY